MRLQDAVDYFGSKTKLAAALENCSPQAVSQWGEYISKGRACEIQLITKGRLKYVPKPKELKQAS